MSSLKKPYEISVWQDYYEGSELKEKKVLVIGSNLMTSQNRAIEPKFVTNINGTHTLTFTLYFKYQDTETGEEVENQFIPYLANETKVKLKYDGEWYDFIVKNIVESSDKKAFSYTLSDLYINELSKTGFDITLATELENNVGSVVELAQTALEGTDWVVGTSETIVQENKEILFTFTTNISITAIPLTKGNSGITPGASVTIPSNATIYGFYSCCSAREKRFQFIYMNGADIQVDSERVILNGQQYYIDNVQYNDNTAYSVGIPNFCNNNPILDNYRGAKFVFTQVSKRDTLLNRIVKKYTKDNKTYWGYVDTQYVSPNIITDYVSNGSEIKTTSGWRAGILGDDTTVKPDLDAVTLPSIPDLISQGEPLKDQTYTPYLKLGFKGSNGVIVNSGFTDSKRLIKDIALGEKFVCYFDIKTLINNGFYPYCPDAIKVAEYSYDVQTANYTITKVFLDFDFNNFQQDGSSDYWYSYTESIAQISEAELKALDTKIGIFIQYNENRVVYLKDFKLFRYYDKGDGTPILPSEQNVEAKVVNTYYYYRDHSEVIPSPTSADEIEYDKQDAPDSSYIPAYTINCEKQKIVNISQSNRFNIIHTLCESFECWASFEINHDETGAIIPFVEGQDYGKQIVFRNYVGQENPVDLRYGVNVKSIQRTLDSKQLTTKLIVKANSNQYAPNGMCTIARAAANPTGETTIFNFDYYVNQGLLDAGELEKDLYLESSPYMGYYVKLARINKQMRAISEKLVTLQVPLAKARAEVQEYEAGALGAEDKFETIEATLEKGYGLTYNQLINSDPPDPEHEDPIYTRMQEDEKLVNYVVEATQYYQAAIDYNTKLESARRTLNQYEAQQQSLQGELSGLVTNKQTLNTNFFKKYSRFIQEGTWTSESYTDENLYFYDAQAVSYESSVPSVTYSISVIDVSPLEGYELYKYQLGDRTYIQDTEFFGYTEIDGVKTPAREGIVVTELTYNLDQPENNTFKVQTYKNQFQDLFQRVGATVQQLKLSTGAYNRAAALAEADVAHKVEFLQGALNDAATVLMNNADQTVVWDNTGITITNNLDRSQILRLVSGGLLLSTDGGQSWQLGITAEGISANKITSGQVDTSLIQIMNGSEAYFRWDAFGITAFDFDNPDKIEYINGLNTSKGVRFDKFGIYSFFDVDGTNWYPQNVSQVREHSIFDLTNEGLHINLGRGEGFIRAGQSSQDVYIHDSESFLGRVDNNIYNNWNGTTPRYINSSTYPEFVKVMSIITGPIGNKVENLAIYDDGTIISKKLLAEGAEISGKIIAERGEIGGFTINPTKLYASYNDSGATKYVGLQTDDETSTTNLIFAGATSETGTGAVFYVRQDGYLYSTKGTIGGWDINEHNLYYEGYTNMPTEILLNASEQILVPSLVYKNENSNPVLSNLAFSAGIDPIPADIEEWDSTKTYWVGAIVSYNNKLWRSRVYNNTSVPSTLTSPWYPFTYDSESGYGYKVGDIVEVITPGCATKKYWISLHNDNTALPSQENYYDWGDYYTKFTYFRDFMVLQDGSVYANYIKTDGLKVSNDVSRISLYTDKMPVYWFGGSQKSGQYTVALYSNNINLNHIPKRINGSLDVAMFLNSYSLGFVTNRFDYGGTQVGISDYSLLAADFIEIGNDDEEYTCVRISRYGIYYTSPGGPYGSFIRFDSDTDIIMGGSSYTYQDCRIVTTTKELLRIKNYNQDYGGKLYETWHVDNAIVVDSDQSIKNSISPLSNKYSILFDKLIPSSYKYNSGTSNRLHIGFIAQEVLNAIRQAGLTTKDFAPYVEYKGENGELICGLRYEEFIALNTWQIQLLKSRVSELEQKLFTLEAKLNVLQNQ